MPGFIAGVINIAVLLLAIYGLVRFGAWIRRKGFKK